MCEPNATPTPFGFSSVFSSIWVLIRYTIWVLICVKWREESVAVSVQLLPADGPASDLREASRSSASRRICHWQWQMPVCTVPTLDQGYNGNGRCRFAQCPPWTKATHRSGASKRNPAWLNPAIMPHPSVELIKPAAVASSIPAVSNSTLAVCKAVVKGWSPVPLHEACQWREWHPAHDIPSQANVQAGEVRAAGSIIGHGHFVPLSDCIWSQCDGFKSAEEHQGESLVLPGMTKGAS